MIKLAELVAITTQVPNEKARMRDFLNRGSRDQINLHPNPYTVVGSQKGTIEGKGMLDTSNHPENKNKVVPWSWDQANLFEDLHGALIGREFQTMDDLKKMVIRLKSAGYAESEIKEFILNYIG